MRAGTITVGLLSLLAGCDTIETLPVIGTPAARMPTGVSYDVTVADSRRLALVRVSGTGPTIAAIEAAARRESGCRATAAAPLYAATGDARDVALPRDALVGFGGAVPVTLEC